MSAHQALAALAALAVLAALLAAPLAAQAPATAERTSSGDVPRVRAEVPGTIVDLAELPGHGVLLLVAPSPPPRPDGEGDDTDAEADDDEDLPRHLYLLTPEGTIAAVADGLAPEVDAVASVAGAVWLGEPGRLLRLAVTAGDGGVRLGEPATLLADPAVDLDAARAGGRLDAATGRLAVVDTGALRGYVADGAALRLEREVPLPLRAERSGRELVLRTPPVALLGDGGRLAVGPESHGAVRLRVLLGRGETAEGDGDGEAWEEAWAQLPAPERVEHARVVHLDGRPTLVAVVRTANKLGIFEKARLRVFGLAADRSRAGRRPMLGVETASRPWQSVDTVVADADGDGRQDLVVVHEEGMSGEDLLVDVYFGDGRGGLRPSQTARVTLRGAGGVWRYGEDATGDGVPDLVSQGDGRLRVFPGRPGDRRRPLDRDAWLDLDVAGAALPPETVTVTVGAGGGSLRATPRGRPRVLDVDGDGRRELLVVVAFGDDDEATPDRDGVLWAFPSRSDGRLGG